MNNIKVLVHLHLYYWEQIEFFISKLENITCDFDLFVTYVSENISKKRKLKKIENLVQCRGVYCVQVDNEGFDIRPFVTTLSNVSDLLEYDYVVKLHTKNFRKIPWRPKDIGGSYYGFEWRDELVNALIGSEKIFQNNLKIFERDNTIGMLANKALLKKIKNENETQKVNTAKLCKKLNLSYEGNGYFVAGTMFMCKSNILTRISQYHASIQSDGIFIHNTGSTGSIWHSVETIFGILVQSSGYRLFGVSYNHNNFRKRIFVQPIAKIKKMFKKNMDYDIISGSHFFNREWYLNKNLDVKNAKIDPVVHYIKCGWREGRNPSALFDGNKYLSAHLDVKNAGINPLLHYEKYGKHEKRIIHFEGKKSKNIEKQKVQMDIVKVTIPKDLSIESVRSEKEYDLNSKICIVLEECSLDVIDKIVSQIQEKHLKFDIYLYSSNVSMCKQELLFGFYNIFYRNRNVSLDCDFLIDLVNGGSYNFFYYLHGRYEKRWDCRHYVELMHNSCFERPVFFYNLNMLKEERATILFPGLETVKKESSLSQSFVCWSNNKGFLSLLKSDFFIKSVENYFYVGNVDDAASLKLITRGNRFNGKCYYSKNNLYDNFYNKTSMEEKIKKYNKSEKNKKIAFYTTSVGNYDKLILHEYFIDAADYYAVVNSDKEIDTYGIYKIVKIPFFDINSTKIARFIKTHPHMLFSEYDIVIWLDANVMIRDDIGKVVESFIESNRPIGTFRHPSRTNIISEGNEIIAQKKDSEANVSSQLSKYKLEGYNCYLDGLAETNVLFFNMRHSKLLDILNLWWLEIFLGSQRDQLSFNYSLRYFNEDYFPLLKYEQCARSNPIFAVFEHGSWLEKCVKKIELPTLMERATDKKEIRHLTCNVVICVHNSRKEVEQCLDSVLKYSDGIKRVFVINDGSEKETRDLLMEYSKKYSIIKVIDHDRAIGYTKSANEGMKLSIGDATILLNSDTIVTKNWVPKMMQKLFSSDSYGLVGPISNAASYQSVPSIKGSTGQTAINILPNGYSVDDMNGLMEKLSVSNNVQITGLVHGFCFGIKNILFEKIGYFDEINFPIGYGEENDFAIRAYKAGYYGIVALDTYVYHVKSTSFKADQRIKFMRHGNDMLKKIHGEKIIKLLTDNFSMNVYLAQLRSDVSELY